MTALIKKKYPRPSRAIMSHESNTIGLSQGEIAEKLGITRSRVSQLEKRAMRKLRDEAERRGIKLEDILRAE